MNRPGLPGIEGLFREQERLAKKLSQEELNALRRYLQRTVHAECETIVARMRYLQTAHEVNEAQFQRALANVHKDLQLQQTVAGEFRREFSSLTKVLQAREQRYTARQDTLVQQVLQARDTVREAVQAREVLEAELVQKEKELDQQKDMVVELEDQLVNHKNCEKVRQDAARLHTDLLKVKVENDGLQKALGDLRAKQEADTKTVGPSRTGKGAAKRVGGPQKQQQPGNDPQGRFLPSVPTPKCVPVTFIPVSPYCTSNSCRARQDLEECRAQFIKKCQEVVFLKGMLSEQKAKSREKLILPARCAHDKPSATIRPLKPLYHLLPSARSGAHSKSFKFGAALSSAGKKK